MRTTIAEENEGFAIHRTNPAQNPASSGGKMRFPVKIKHRHAKAVIYGKTAGYDFYRVAITAAGKRCLKSFQTYSEAKEYAEAKVRELARGDQAAALTPKESTDTLTIRTVLDDFRRDTGRSVTALEAVKAYLHAMRKPGDRQLDAAVDGYLNSVAEIKRKDVGEAVTEFAQYLKGQTKSANDKRPQLCPKHAYNLEIQLRSFANTFPRHRAVRPHQEPCGRLLRRAWRVHRQDEKSPAQRRQDPVSLGRPPGLPAAHTPPERIRRAYPGEGQHRRD